MPKILVVEDDKALSKVVTELLELERYNVDLAETGRKALDYLESFEYDLLILDRQLPEISGIEICKHYRSSSKGPVLMLTGMNTVTDRVDGLEAGADDYLAKPFDSRELLARVRALLRRATDFQSGPIKIGELHIDLDSHIISRGDKRLSLTPREFEVLEYFLKNPNKVISPEALLKRVWHSDSEASPHAVYTCINRLRKNLDPADKEAVIKTVHGVGYRFEN